MSLRKSKPKHMIVHMCTRLSPLFYFYALSSNWPKQIRKAKLDSKIKCKQNKIWTKTEKSFINFVLVRFMCTWSCYQREFSIARQREQEVCWQILSMNYASFSLIRQTQKTKKNKLYAHSTGAKAKVTKIKK